MSWTWEQVKGVKTSSRESVEIVMDRDWGDRLREAQIRLGQLRRELAERPSDTTLKPELDDLERLVTDLSAEKPSKVCRFVFRGLPPDRYERIVKAHPATKEQRTQGAKLGGTPGYDVDTFPLALVQACLVEPHLTREQVAELWDAGDPDLDIDDPAQPAGARWTSAELAALFLAAQSANVSRQLVE
jgi:hypothetical protein